MFLLSDNGRKIAPGCNISIIFFLVHLRNLEVDDVDKTWLDSDVTFRGKRSDGDCGLVRLLKRAMVCP